MHQNGDANVTLKNGESIRLVDDAFARVCDLVNDPSLSVRVESARTLGSFEGVSDGFLLQTFSKEVISHLKRKKRILEVSNMDLESADIVAKVRLTRQWYLQTLNPRRMAPTI